MTHKAIRIREETHRMLRFVAAHEACSLVEALHRVTEEYVRRHQIGVFYRERPDCPKGPSCSACRTYPCVHPAGPAVLLPTKGDREAEEPAPWCRFSCKRCGLDLSGGSYTDKCPGCGAALYGRQEGARRSYVIAHHRESFDRYVEASGDVDAVYVDTSGPSRLLGVAPLSCRLVFAGGWEQYGDAMAASPRLRDVVMVLMREGAEVVDWCQGAGEGGKEAGA